jgi:hypothetical protein
MGCFWPGQRSVFIQVGGGQFCANQKAYPAAIGHYDLFETGIRKEIRKTIIKRPN